MLLETENSNYGWKYWIKNWWEKKKKKKLKESKFLVVVIDHKLTW